MVQEAGGIVVGLGFVVELTFLSGRGRLDRPRRLLAAAVRQMSAADPPGTACARWPRSISICACSASAPTAFTNCAPSSRPSRWPTRSRSPSRRRGRPRSRSTDDLAHPRQPGGARRAAGAGSHARHRPRRDAADQANPHGRGTWAADRPMPRRCCWRCPCWPAARSRSAEVECASASSWAATFLSSCWAARRSESGAARSCFRCPTRLPGTGCWWLPGIHVNTAQAYRDLSPRLTTELQQNKIFSFQSLTWDTGRLARRSQRF